MKKLLFSIILLALFTDFIGYGQTTKNSNRLLIGYSALKVPEYSGLFFGTITQNKVYLGISINFQYSKVPYNIKVTKKDITYANYNLALDNFSSYIGHSLEDKILLNYFSAQLGYKAFKFIWPFVGIGYGSDFRDGFYYQDDRIGFIAKSEEKKVLPGVELGILIYESNFHFPLNGFIKYCTVTNSIGLGIGVSL